MRGRRSPRLAPASDPPGAMGRRRIEERPSDARPLVSARSEVGSGNAESDMSGNVQVRSFERPIPPEDFARLQALCGKSLYLQAYELASRFGPFREWTGTAERILAGRLAWNLGARRL